MAMLAIQGFEHILPTTVGEGHITAAETSRFLGFPCANKSHRLV